MSKVERVAGGGEAGREAAGRSNPVVVGGDRRVGQGEVFGFAQRVWRAGGVVCPDQAAAVTGWSAERRADVRFLVGERAQKPPGTAGVNAPVSMVSQPRSSGR